MTRLDRCPHDGCYNLKPVGKDDCGCHPTGSRKCATEGCDSPVRSSDPRCLYCQPCLRKRRTQQEVAAKKKRIEMEENAVLEPKFEPWRRKTEPPRDLTLKEVMEFQERNIKADRELDQRRATLNPTMLAARMTRGSIMDMVTN